MADAAEAEPEKYRPLVEEMDTTGRVSGAHRKLKVAKEAKAINAEPPPLPEGPFRVLVVDPPWPYENRKVELTGPEHAALALTPSPRLRSRPCMVCEAMAL